MSYFKLITAVTLVWPLILVDQASAQLLNQPGQVWKTGSPTDSNYIEMQVTNVTATTFSGAASFRHNGQWIGMQESAFSGTHQPTEGSVLHFDAECADGTKFSGWLFPGTHAGTNEDDFAAVYYTPDAVPPCPSVGSGRHGVLRPGNN